MIQRLPDNTIRALDALAELVRGHELARQATEAAIGFAVAEAVEQALQHSTDLDPAALPAVGLELDAKAGRLFVSLTWAT